MSAQQKRPFYVFLAVSFVCLLVIASGVRSRALVDAVTETVESAVATAPRLSPLTEEPEPPLTAAAPSQPTAPRVADPDTGPARTGDAERADDRAREGDGHEDRSRHVGPDDHHPGKHRGQPERAGLADEIDDIDVPPGLDRPAGHPGRHLGHTRGRGHDKNNHGNGHHRGHGGHGALVPGKSTPRHRFVPGNGPANVDDRGEGKSHDRGHLKFHR